MGESPSTLPPAAKEALEEWADEWLGDPNAASAIEHAIAEEGEGFLFPLGPCPGCGNDEYEYTEVGMFPGRKCICCGAILCHHALSPSAPDMEGESR